MCAKKKRRSGLSGADKASARLVALYEAAERDIAARITRALAATDGDKNKLTIRALEQQHKAVKKILRQLLAKTRKPVREIVNSAFSGGLAVARKELKDAGITDIVLEMGGINAKAMAVYSEQVYSRMADVVQQANRTTTDIYRALKLNTSLGGAVGGYDAIGNVRRNMQKVSEDAGITAFIDKRGRSWTMASYTDMLCRTSSMQIYHQAKTNEFLAHGEDLVIVSSHTPTCDKCAPWNGKILSLTGETPGYPTMAEAEAAGLFHPNCRHTYGLYVEESEEERLTRAAEQMDVMTEDQKKSLISQLAERAGQSYNPNNKHGDDIFYDDNGEPVYPPNGGARWPQKEVILKAGAYADRYGRPDGKFLAPVGTSFEARALPKTEDATISPTVYITLRDVRVLKGITMSWFGEPGGGVQYKLPKKVKSMKDDFAEVK